MFLKIREEYHKIVHLTDEPTFCECYDIKKKLHCLQIETGRYINIPHQQRLCTTCNILEDEYHFFLNCHLNQQPRNLLIITIENKCPSFTNMSPMNRLDYILNPTSDLLSVVCTFIKQLLDLR